MITDVATAFMTRYNIDTGTGTALRAVLTGGLWFMEAKPSVSFPYGVFVWDGLEIEEICGGPKNRINAATLDVHLYSKNDDGGTEVFDLIDKFQAHFDAQILIFPDADYSHIQLLLKSIVNRGKLDNIWEMILTYEEMYEG